MLVSFIKEIKSFQEAETASAAHQKVSRRVGTGSSVVSLVRDMKAINMKLELAK